MPFLIQGKMWNCLINQGRLEQAQEILDGVPPQNRDAEWYFLSGMIDYRFGWSNVPMWVVITASAILLISYGLYAEVMRENAYLSRTIEVQEGQKVVDSGLYGIVRHPMYTATLLMFLAMPLILGSLWGEAIFAVYPMLIVKRIQNEEQVLAAGLKGYTDYQQRVRWRLIPWVW